MKKRTFEKIIIVNLLILGLSLIANHGFIKWISHTIYTSGAAEVLSISWVKYTGAMLIIDTTAKRITETHTLLNYPLLFLVIGIAYNLFVLARLFLSNRFIENGVDKGSGLHLF